MRAQGVVETAEGGNKSSSHSIFTAAACFRSYENMSDNETAVERYRARIFELEKKVTFHTRQERDLVEKEQNARKEATGHLMKVNKTLMDKLRSLQKDELGKAAQKLVEAQKENSQLRSDLMTKDKELSKQLHRLAAFDSQKDEFVKKVKRVEKKEFELSVAEGLLAKQERARLETLQNYLKGEIDLDDLYEVDSECDSFKPPSDWGIKEKSEQFKKFYAERQSQFDSSIQEYQKMITTKRAEYQRLAVEVQKAGAALHMRSKKPIKEDLVIEYKDAACQTPVGNNSRRSRRASQIPNMADVGKMDQSPTKRRSRLLSEDKVGGWRNIENSR